MALEIRELLIKATITDSGGAALHGQALQEAMARMKQELLRECVARVLDEITHEQQR